MEPTDTARALVADLAEILAATERPYPPRVVDDLLARAELLAAELSALVDHVDEDVAADAAALCRDTAARCGNDDQSQNLSVLTAA